MVTLKIRSRRAVDVPFVVRDASLDIVEQGMVGGTQRVRVQPGAYVVEAELGEGKPWRKAVMVEGDLSVELPADPEPEDRTTPVGLRIADLLGHAADLRWGDDHRPWTAGGHLYSFGIDDLAAATTKSLQPGDLTPEALPTIRLALWRREGDGWVLDPEPSLAELGGVHNELRFLRVTGGRHDRLIALPRHIRQIEICLTRDEARVVDADPEAELLVKLQAQRRHRAAALLAVSKLQGKRREPIGAAEGAVALLKVLGELEEHERPPLQWFYNLTEWFPWLPDGPVAAAWYGLYLDELDVDEARRLLLLGYRRGIPALTAALRLLRDGLELAAMDKTDTEVHEALRTVSGWVAVAEPDPVRTTLLAGSPVELDAPVDPDEGLLIWTLERELEPGGWLSFEV